MLYLLDTESLYFVGDLFKQRLDEFLRRGLRKGVPSLFINLKTLYKDEEKISVIADLIKSYYKNLKELKYFSEQGLSISYLFSPFQQPVLAIHFAISGYVSNARQHHLLCLRVS